MPRLSCLEVLVVCITIGITANMLLQMPPRTIRVPPVSYQNVELQAAVADVWSTLQNENGTRSDYTKHFQWENPGLRKRRVWLETQEKHSLRGMIQRLERSAQVRFEYLEAPHHGLDGRYIIRDARQKQPLRPKAAPF